MGYRKLSYQKLSSISGGLSYWGIVYNGWKIGWSAWQHRRSFGAGYKASPFH